MRNDSFMPRRRFLQMSAATIGTVGSLSAMGVTGKERDQPERQESTRSFLSSSKKVKRPYNGAYFGPNLDMVAFPLGGIGAGMVCLEGTGALSHVSVRNRPEVFHEPLVFAALCLKGKHPIARVLEGPVPARKLFGPPGTGNGAGGTTYGLPRFASASFQARFPFGTVTLTDDHLPLTVELVGWSPFEPGDADNSSLPVAALEYRFVNRSHSPLEAVFSFTARNFMASGNQSQEVRPITGGFILWGGGPKDKPWEEGSFSAAVTEPTLKVNHALFRGGWFDALTMAWKDVAEGACVERGPVTEGGPSPGASLSVPFQLAPGASRTIALRLAWFCGQTNLRIGKDPGNGAPAPDSPRDYRPWYAGPFADIHSVSSYWRDYYD